MNDFAAEAKAATEAFVAESQQQRSESIPETVAATKERVAELMVEGGRVLCTVRSRATDRHVTVLLSCKKKEDGRFVSRQRIAGRVGIGQAAAVFCDDPQGGEWLGTYYPRDGGWREGRGDPGRTWAARAVLRWFIDGYDLDEQAEVFIATECCYCGKRLTDPVSVERGIGPECFKRRTGSKAAPRAQGTLAA